MPAMVRVVKYEHKYDESAEHRRHGDCARSRKEKVGAQSGETERNMLEGTAQGDGENSAA